MICCYALSDIGKKRRQNEDVIYSDSEKRIFAIADGVGGRNHGEVAAAIAIETIKQKTDQICGVVDNFVRDPDRKNQNAVLEFLDDLYQCASHQVFEEAETKGQHGMVTTLVAAFVGGGAVFLSHAGDSRAYLLRNEQLIQLTEDHSLINELMHNSQMDAATACKQRYRNVIVRGIGIRPNVKPDLVTIDILPGDRFILCSDGLSDVVAANKILECLTVGSPADATRALVNAALDAGGKDNVSVVTFDPQTTPMDEAAMARATIMSQLFLFEGLPFASRAKVSRLVQEIPVIPGQNVVKQGSTGQALYVVTQGHFNVERNGVFLTTLGPGDHFGELSLVDAKPRSATVIAKEYGNLIMIDRSALDYFCQKEPELGNHILWRILETVSYRLRDSNVRLTDPAMGNF